MSQLRRQLFESKYNWVDNLSIIIQTNEFADWLRYDAR